MSVSEIYYQEDVQKYLKNEYGTTQWIQVCGHKDIFGADAGFWCGFIPIYRVEAALKDYSWDVSMTAGTPGFEITGDEIVYKSRLEDHGEEALLYYRNFYGVAADYVEISQEFILLNNLRYDRKCKCFFAMYDSGEQEEAIRYNDDCSIQIKLKFLKQYATAKQLAIVLEYDIKTDFSGQLSDYGVSEFDEIVRDSKLCYSICGGQISIPKTVFSRVLGKKVIMPEPIEKCGFWPYEKEKNYEDFIIGSDNDGNPVSYTSDPNQLNNYFGSNPDAPMYLTPVFFSREVLQKYYAKPELYKVTDGQLSCQSLWGIEIDNHHKDVVAVYLGDLGRDLPEVEQKHWKNYNVLTDESLSEVSFARDLMCYGAESNIIEHQFKRDYIRIQKLWEESFGWSLYRSLEGEDSYVFDQIRRPMSDSQAEFDQLVLLLCKLLIDALNEKDIANNIRRTDTLRGINKLEQWLVEADATGYEDHIAFLRNLWDLRSSGCGHAKGKRYKKACVKFNLDNIPLPDVYDEILRDADAYLKYMIENFT